MMQKSITVGNSKALTISNQILKQIDFNPQEVSDPEVYSVAKNLLKRYAKAFAELAKK